MEQPETVTLRDYTEAFKVRRAMRKIGKAHIPLKEGLFVDDLKVFGIALIAWVFGYNFVIRPPLRFLLGLAGMNPPTGFTYILLLFFPPIMAVAMSRRPLRHGLLLFGLVRSVLRDLMDDPVHRRGVPVTADRSPQSYRMVVWRANPELIPALAARTPLPNGFSTVAPKRTSLALPSPATVPAKSAAADTTGPVGADSTTGSGTLAALSEDELAADFVISSRRV